MKKLLILSIALLPLFSFLRLTSAAEPSPSPSPSESEITENLKKRLQESLTNAKETVLSAENNSRPIAYVGSVQDVIHEAIDIKTKDGQRYAKIKEDTTVLRSPGNVPIDLEDIRIDDFIIAMGYSENDTTVGAKRVIVSQTAVPSLAKTTGTGKITALSQSTMTITNPEGDEVELRYLRSTIVKSKNDVLSQADLKVGDSVIYTADTGKELTATIIMIISPAPQEEGLTTEENDLE